MPSTHDALLQHFHSQEGAQALLTPLAQGLARDLPAPLDAPALDALARQSRRWAFRLMFIALAEARQITDPSPTRHRLCDLTHATDDDLLRWLHTWLDVIPAVTHADADPAPPPDALRDALDALDALPDGDWTQVSSRTLGALHEASLEFHLAMTEGALRWTHAAGHTRKTTGSYYTPDLLIQRLLDATLSPLISTALNAQDPTSAILSLRICDPACGAGDFLVAAGHRLTKALRRAHLDQHGAPAPPCAIAELWTACLYGVDLSPIALAIAQTALQQGAAAYGAMLPAQAFSPRFKCGNALLGAPMTLPAQPPPQSSVHALTGDDPSRLRAERQHARRARASTPRPDSAHSHAPTPHRALIADAWCAAFLWPRLADSPPSPHQTWDALRERSPDAADTEAQIDALRREFGFVHWSLTFPEVFERPRAGFDAVVGNPPWERLKLQEREFFASHAPEVAAPGKAAARRRRIQALITEDPPLHDLYLRAKRHAEAQLHFARRSGRYPLCGRGDINAYALFTELSQELIHHDGVVGLIVPSGIATDRDTRHFFQALIDGRKLKHLHHFDNRARLFHRVGAMITFCLLTFTRRPHPAKHRADFVFFAHHPDDLDQPERHIALDADDIATLNPNTRTCPIFTHQHDAALTLGVYRRFPILDDRTHGDNPWGLRLGTLFHMTNDSHLFDTREPRRDAQADDDRWPLWEAKMIHHYDHRYGDFRELPRDRRSARIPAPTPARRDDPDYEPIGRYWVTEDALDAAWPAGWHRRWMIGWRDVCRSTDERTVIAAAMPPVPAGNTLTVSQIDATSLAACFVACASSLALDTIARFKVGGAHLNYFILRQLPFPPPERFADPAPWTQGATLGQWMTPRALALIHTTRSLDAFAHDCGADGPPHPWDIPRRAALRAQLDAAFFHLYGFTRPQTLRALESFQVLKRKDEAAHGQFETARRVMIAYDAMAERGSG